MLLLFAVLQASQAEPLRAPPTDQCGGDPTFVAYREELKAAVAGKDVAALKPLLSPTILVSLGEERGWIDFVREWKLDRPQESDLWVELANVLRLGCEEVGNSRIMPGNFSRLSEFDDDWPAFFAVEKDAPLRSRPDDSALIVMALDNHILLWDSGVPPQGWLHVRLTNGKSGYVRESAVRSAIDYRAGFEQRDGKWVMDSFVAGD